MNATKVFLIVALTMFMAGMFPAYMEMNRLDTKKPFQERYAKSSVIKVVPYSLVARAHVRFPVITEFVVGLDPRVSRMAGVRWSVLAMIGWTYFCFILAPNRLSQQIPAGLSLFLLPVKTVLWILPLFAVSHILKYFNPIYAGYLHSSILWTLGTVGVAVGTAGLLAVPAHLAFMIVGIKQNGQRNGSRKSLAELPGPVVRRTEIDGVTYDF